MKSDKKDLISMKSSQYPLFDSFLSHALLFYLPLKRIISHYPPLGSLLLLEWLSWHEHESIVCSAHSIGVTGCRFLFSLISTFD